MKGSHVQCKTSKKHTLYLLTLAHSLSHPAHSDEGANPGRVPPARLGLFLRRIQRIHLQVLSLSLVLCICLHCLANVSVPVVIYSSVCAGSVFSAVCVPRSTSWRSAAACGTIRARRAASSAPPSRSVQTASKRDLTRMVSRFVLTPRWDTQLGLFLDIAGRRFFSACCLCLFAMQRCIWWTRPAASAIRVATSRTSTPSFSSATRPTRPTHAKGLFVTLTLLAPCAGRT